MRIAILHNPRPPCRDATMPDDAFEEYDSEETIAAIAAALGLAIFFASRATKPAA